MLRYLFLVFTICLSFTSNAIYGQKQEKTYIFGIGSSFMEDMLARVPELLEADTALFDFTYLRLWGGSLKDHLELIHDNSPEYICLHYNNTTSTWDCDTLRFSDALDRQDWDIFLLQQSAQYSGKFETIKNTLTELLGILNTRFPSALHYWHQTWAFANNSDNPGFSLYDHSQSKMYYEILQASSHIVRETFASDFVGIIPDGAVIQQLRNSHINDGRDLCRDTYHLDQALGRYAASSTFYEAVLSPLLNKSVLSIQTRPSADSIRTTRDYSYIRQMAYDVVHNDSLIWQSISPHFIYRTDNYDLSGRPIKKTPTSGIYVANQLMVNGDQRGLRICISKP